MKNASIALSVTALLAATACTVAPSDWTTTTTERRDVALGGRSFTVDVSSKLSRDSLSDDSLGALSLSAGTMLSGPHVAYRVSKELVPPKTMDEAVQGALSTAPRGGTLVKKSAFRGGFLVHVRTETSVLVTMHFPLKGGASFQCLADYMTPGLFADTKTILGDADAPKYLAWLERMCTPQGLAD